ncbi:MAG: hypothetical protein QXO37_08340 [Candidatus Nitrosocaldaceae archaeon]
MALGLDAGILLMATIVAVIAFVAVVNLWLIPETQAWFIDAMIKMPRFEYNQDTNTGNANYETYDNLRTVSIVIIAIAMTFSAFILFGEEFYIFRKDQAFTILAHGVLSIFVILVFPILWDMFAIFIEQLSYYILNPENPNDMNAINNKVEFIFQQIGSPQIDWNTVLQMLTDPLGAAQTIFQEVFLAVFKAFIAALSVFLMFVIGTVRIVLTAIFAIALPMILALALLPFADRVMNRLKDILIGLSFAPILSSLVITAGVAFLNSSNFSPLQNWMASIAIGLLAISIPTITAPVVGSVVSQLTMIGSSAMLAGLYFGSSSVVGAIRGASSAVSTAIMSNVPFNALSIAKAAITGAGKGFAMGATSGLLKEASEGLKSMGFGKISSPIESVSSNIERRIGKVGATSASKYISEYTGTVTEGLLPYLATQERSDLDMEASMNFANNINKLASEGRYESIADLSNQYLGFKNIPNKEAFGKAFAEEIQAFSKSKEALARVYAGLEDIKSKGGINSLDADTLAHLVLGRDMLRGIASKEFGIEIPNPNFEASSYIQLPKQLEAIAPDIISADYILSNTLAEAEANPTVTSINEKPGALQIVIAKGLSEYWKSQHIDVGKSNHIIQEFSHITARKIAEAYADRPEVIYTFMKQLDNEDINFDLSKIASKRILSSDDINNIYERHKDHAEDFSAFFTNI